MTDFSGFFDHDPACSTAFARLRDALEKRYPGTEILAQKTCLSFRDPRPYCYVSLSKAWNRKREPERSIVITFSLDAVAPDTRIMQAVPVTANRITHHVAVHSPEEIDEQLLMWIFWAHRLKCKA